MEDVGKDRFEVPISSLPLNAVKMLPVSSKISDVIHLMQKEGFGSSLLEDQGRPVGIVTERDLVMKYTGHYQEFLESEVSTIMTTKLISIQDSVTVRECMILMGTKRIRHLPVEVDGQISKMISVNDLLKFIIDKFPVAVKSMGTLKNWSVNEVHVQDENFSFQQKTGQISGNMFLVPLKKVVTRDLIKMDIKSSISEVIMKMQKLRNGMVVLTQHETILKGIITERDILKKVFGKQEINNNVLAKNYMTPNPDTLLEKHVLSYAINNMYQGKYRNIILVDEERIPVSYVALVDIIKAVSDKLST
ncbi:MAG: CBS domain-containing protein [Deltaproteobacteria bacterium]|nr:MAG: CBS domain-containing protein [Deltaproteobacteria bacterium]TNF26269.1 MAG: CBS domain-containing protein [Deltaproteobacteria bacterium]